MRRVVLMTLVIAALVVALGMAGCADSACPPDQVSAALDKMSDVTNRLSEPAEQLQAADSIEDLASIREDFQALRDEADAIDVPGCMVEAKSEMVAAFDKYIEAIAALEVEDFDAANDAVADADVHLERFQELIGELANR